MALGLSLVFGVVNAECLTNNKGETFCGAGECNISAYGEISCSAFYKGTAVKTKYGDIVCGIGKCVVTRLGEVACSTEIEGVATLDRYGNPRCQGSCETASTDYCESTPIGN